MTRKPGGGGRKPRIEHALREAVTDAIAAEVRDPRVHAPTMLTVSRVEMNADMSIARCYVSIVAPSDEIRDAALTGLNKATGFLRGPVARQVGLQRAPELRFALDESLDVSDQLAAIVRDDVARARAAGRGPEPGGRDDAAPASGEATERIDLLDEEDGEADA